MSEPDDLTFEERARYYCKLVSAREVAFLKRRARELGLDEIPEEHLDAVAEVTRERLWCEIQPATVAMSQAAYEVYMRETFPVVDDAYLAYRTVLKLYETN